MRLKYSPLILLPLLAACDGYDGSAPTQQSSGTFEASSTQTTASATTPDGATTILPNTPAQQIDVSTSTTLEQAVDLVRTGNANRLVEAGLALEFGTRMAAAGYETEAYALLAPPEYKVEDRNTYDTKGDGSIDPTLVDETPSAKHHVLSINGKDVNFTAHSGHLIAYAPKDAKKAGATDQEAAVFYTAYTRDGLPKEKRPVTFFWNGGPGSSSIWLHLGSWAPWRLKSDAPSIPEQFYYARPDSFPFEANAITLLDKSDLVFIDPAGTGYSSATAPHKNRDFWGVDADARLVADFITRYNNVNNRQSSPKYLYGESYGGIRTPIVADLLEDAGTSRFDADPSNKPAIALSGIVLNSPILDYLSDCSMADFSKLLDSVAKLGPKDLAKYGWTAAFSLTEKSCAGFVPTYAMAADYHKLSTTRGTASQEDYRKSLENYVTNTYIPTVANNPNVTDPQTQSNPWATFAASNQGTAFLADLSAKTGIAADTWKAFPNLSPRTYQPLLMPDWQLGRYDSRMKAPADSSFAPDDYINDAFLNQSKTFFPDYANYVYSGSSIYQPLNNEVIENWTWPHRGSVGQFSPSSIVDLQETVNQNPQVKLLVLHGYEDFATPGFQTELDLKSVKLTNRVPVKWFEGGHMIYNTEVSRGPLKAELDKYYDNPQYSFQPPAVAAAAAALD